MPSTTDAQKQNRPIVILGGGVIGLTIAHVLSEDPDRANAITVVARELPEHHMQSGGWASPWAGANWSPLGEYDEKKIRWERRTVEHFRKMVGTGLIAELPYNAYYDDAKDFVPDPLWKEVVGNVTEIPSSELPEGVQKGLAFKTISLRPAEYMPWLMDQLVKRGVSFIPKHVASIEEAAHIGGKDAVLINATGLGAKSLLGVEDKDVYPIRGQTIIVDAPEAKTHVVRITPGGDPTYIIPRPDGTAILGGSYHPDRYDLLVDNALAAGIHARCSVLEPALKDTQVLSLNVGLRPARKGGARVEKEVVSLPLKGALVPYYGVTEEERTERELTVVHAYGLGPAGFQSSWGVAWEVEEILASI